MASTASSGDRGGGGPVAGSSHHGRQANSSSSLGGGSESIQMLVDNVTFIVNPDIFANKKDTMLYRMFFSSASLAKPNEKGQYVIEGFSAAIFEVILVSCYSTAFDRLCDY